MGRLAASDYLAPEVRLDRLAHPALPARPLFLPPPCQEVRKSSVSSVTSVRTNPFVGCNILLPMGLRMSPRSLRDRTASVSERQHDRCPASASEVRLSSLTGDARRYFDDFLRSIRNSHFAIASHSAANSVDLRALRAGVDASGSSSALSSDNLQFEIFNLQFSIASHSAASCLPKSSPNPFPTTLPRIPRAVTRSGVVPRVRRE